MVRKTFKAFREEAPVNVVGGSNIAGIAGLPEIPPVSNIRKSKIRRRRKIVTDINNRVI